MSMYNNDYIEFKYISHDDKGNRNAVIKRMLLGEQTEYLPNVLQAFVYFLNGMTFTYIDTIVAVGKDGEHSSQESHSDDF